MGCAFQALAPCPAVRPNSPLFTVAKENATGLIACHKAGITENLCSKMHFKAKRIKRKQERLFDPTTSGVGYTKLLTLNLSAPSIEGQSVSSAMHATRHILSGMTMMFPYASMHRRPLPSIRKDPTQLPN